jgi:hypothetical protein
MHKHLEDYPLRDLVKEAKLLARIKPVAKLNRVCLRHKRAAICWLVENDPEQLTRARLRIESDDYALPPASGDSWSDAELDDDAPYEDSDS